MQINRIKTKILTNSGTQKSIIIENQVIKQAENVIYLGQLISFQNQADKEINRRLAIAWNKFWSLRLILKGKYPPAYRSQIFNSCVLPALTYGCQTWSLSKRLEQKLKSAQNSMKRAMLGIKLKDKKSIKSIKKKFWRSKNILQLARRLKWDWAGHLSRLENNSWPKIITFWQLKGGRRSSKQRVRWTDDINKFLRHKLYHRIAADRTEWARLRQAFAQKQATNWNIEILVIIM